MLAPSFYDGPQHSGASASAIASFCRLYTGSVGWRINSSHEHCRPRSPSPTAPARIRILAPVGRATVGSVCTIERVTRSRGANDREAASIVQATLASMYGSLDFLGVAHADAVGSHLLRKTAGGNYCNRGQHRNSKRAHYDLSAKALHSLQRLDENATYVLGRIRPLRITNKA